MRIENKTVEAHKVRIPHPNKAKEVVIQAWVPQPNPLTREEIRKLVIDQIG